MLTTMINNILKLMLVIIFISFALFLSGLDFVKLIDLPTIIFIVMGTTIFTAIRCRKGMDKRVLLEKAMQSCLITGVIGLFIGFMSIFTTIHETEKLFPGFAVNLLMIPYTALFYLGIGFYKSRVEAQYADSYKDSEMAETYVVTDITDLSERERDIIQSILSGMSNKEIA